MNPLRLETSRKRKLQSLLHRNQKKDREGFVNSCVSKALEYLKIIHIHSGLHMCLASSLRASPAPHRCCVAKSKTRWIKYKHSFISSLIVKSHTILNWELEYLIKALENEKEK